MKTIDFIKNEVRKAENKSSVSIYKSAFGTESHPQELFEKYLEEFVTNLLNMISEKDFNPYNFYDIEIIRYPAGDKISYPDIKFQIKEESLLFFNGRIKTDIILRDYIFDKLADFIDNKQNSVIWKIMQKEKFNFLKEYYEMDDLEIRYENGLVLYVPFKG